MRPYGEKKILLYYEGIKHPKEPYAGTNAILFNLAKKINSGCNGFHVEMMGDFIQADAVFQGVKIRPTPQKEKLAHTLSIYDMVIFASHINQFRHCTKPAGQVWLLYQHCWKIEPLELSLIHLFDGVICLSAMHREKVILQDVKPGIVDVFPNAIDTAFFRPIESVERRPHSIMFAGAIVPYKGLDILLGAFNRILSAYPDATLDIYGNAEMWNTGNEYEQELKHLNCPNARYLGAAHNSRMPEIYSSHSILCLPSRMESFSLVSIEAQACGCVPVVHNIGGVSVSMRNSQTGFLYSPNTAEHLAEAIHRTFQRIDADPEIRNKCRKYICDTYEIGNNINEFIKLLNRHSPVGANFVTEKEHKMQFEERVRQGITSLMERGETDVGEWMLDKFLIDYPWHAGGHYEKAMLAHACGDSDAAGFHLEKAVELEPDNKLFFKNLAGYLWVEKGDADAALIAYKNALNIDQQDVEALLGFARICLETGRTDDAGEFIDCALSVEPHNQEVAFLRQKMENAYANKSVVLNLSALYDQAQSKISTGDQRGAIEDLEKLVHYSPGCAVAYNDLGVLHYQLGDKENALKAYEKSVQLDPLEANTLKNLADFYLFEQQRVEEAMRFYLKVLEQNPGDIECLLAAGFICTLLKKSDDAADFYRRVIELDPYNRPATDALEKIQNSSYEVNTDDLS